MLVVYVVAFPTTIVSELGVTLSVKLGGGWDAAMMSVTLVVWVKLPLLPVVVS